MSFGHQVTRSNPKARDFVFESRDNIQIIDLAKTKEGLDEAAEFARSLGQRGGSLLVVGTKRQAKDLIDQEIVRIKELLKEAKKKIPVSYIMLPKDGLAESLLISRRFHEILKN